MSEARSVGLPFRTRHCDRTVQQEVPKSAEFRFIGLGLLSKVRYAVVPNGSGHSDRPLKRLQARHVGDIDQLSSCDGS